jgi:hypothetical protein
MIVTALFSEQANGLPGSSIAAFRSTLTIKTLRQDTFEAQSLAAELSKNKTNA